MSAPSWPRGELRERLFVELTAHIAREGLTGLLEVTDAFGTSRGFFMQGVPQGGRPARLKNPIGQILVADNVITEEVLKEALELHHHTDKLLGQVLLEMKVVDEAALQRTVEKQSRLHFVSLFGLSEGQFEFHDGLVHLQGFVPAPLAAIVAIYQGLRDHAPESACDALLAKLTFASVKLSDPNAAALQALGAAEQMALRLLSEHRLAGDLARRVPLPPRALGALLTALNALGLLDIGPAQKAH